MLSSFLLLTIISTVSINNAITQEWKVDLNVDPKPFYYYWDTCVGSGHASLMLRSDWRKWMKNGHDNIGFKYVRGHGILDDDVGSVNNNKQNISFINIDKIYKWLLSINMKPYVEISFMPEVFASGTTSNCHYKGNNTPPKDYNQWYDFIKQWMTHLVQVFGIDEVSTWPLEVWNGMPIFYKHFVPISRCSVSFLLYFINYKQNQIQDFGLEIQNMTHI